MHPDIKKDQWFYATLESGKAYQINLGQDIKLNVTRVWINVLVESGDKVFGMIGTGIDITTFLKETVDIGQERDCTTSSSTATWPCSFTAMPC